MTLFHKFKNEVKCILCLYTHINKVLNMFYIINVYIYFFISIILYSIIIFNFFMILSKDKILIFFHFENI